ncbi:hypothetical protein PAPYR_11324 [Paratrimastix pyriformis]|uniref:Uncharacterized protein n=1 Tax=Paratrimastix pyriformis TaxID=342808 RepID=A0ABQ8U8X8_9EUKA|nr:hypothetical protein PAPYR_11324 [Paratrimastix pyriformis]
MLKDEMKTFSEFSSSRNFSDEPKPNRRQQNTGLIADRRGIEAVAVQRHLSPFHSPGHTFIRVLVFFSSLILLKMPKKHRLQKAANLDTGSVADFNGMVGMTFEESM